MSASQTNLATLHYSNHGAQPQAGGGGGGHRSKLSWSGFSTTPAAGLGSANPSRTSLQPPHPQQDLGQEGYRMSDLGSEVMLDGSERRHHPERRNSSLTDDEDGDEDDDERERLREAEKRGWYAGRAF